MGCAVIARRPACPKRPVQRRRREHRRMAVRPKRQWR
jgi:hypothetical protein